MSRSTASRLAAAALLSGAAVTLPSTLRAQQSDLSVSPFVTFMPTAGASPLAGLALTLAGNSGLALRASGHLSLENTNNASTFGTTPSMRPWGADADAVLFLGGRFMRSNQPRTLAPYVFAGVGLTGVDSIGRTTTTNNWSYGAGLSIPVGGVVDLFGESRWRMSRFVLPTARFAPTPRNEFRFGVSFHVGGGGEADDRRPSRGRRSEAAPKAGGPAVSYAARPLLNVECLESNAWFVGRVAVGVPCTPAASTASSAPAASAAR